MFNYLKKLFLTIFGKIKVFKWPMFIVYDPSTYLVKGQQIREILGIIKPGYIIGRGYDNYLDGWFIPGRYSHTAVVATVKPNKQTVIHSMSQGVFEQDILDFLKCDRIVIFKPRNGRSVAVKTARKMIGKGYDFDFETNDDRFYCHELTQYCFPKLEISPVTIGHWWWKREVYTIDSFTESPDLEIVYEFDPKNEKQGRTSNADKKD